MPVFLNLILFLGKNHSQNHSQPYWEIPNGLGNILSDLPASHFFYFPETLYGKGFQRDV